MQCIIRNSIVFFHRVTETIQNAEERHSCILGSHYWGKKNKEIKSTGKLLTGLVLGYSSSDIYDA